MPAPHNEGLNMAKCYELCGNSCCMLAGHFAILIFRENVDVSKILQPDWLDV